MFLLSGVVPNVCDSKKAEFHRPSETPVRTCTLCFVKGQFRCAYIGFGFGSGVRLGIVDFLVWTLRKLLRGPSDEPMLMLADQCPVRRGSPRPH